MLMDALRAKQAVAAERCPRCSSLVVSHGTQAREAHHDHDCESCDYRFSTAHPVVCNPLADFLPVLTDAGKLRLLSTFRLFRSRGCL